MFLDLSGSTGVAEALGPERSRDLLHAMQTLVEREVTAQRGVVINYMGDGVLAVFGLPKPQSDDAARALTTVESLYRSVAAWVADLPPAVAGSSRFSHWRSFRPGCPFATRFADPSADHRRWRHRQCREPAPRGRKATALPRRRLGRSVRGRNLSAWVGKLGRRDLFAADGSNSRPNGRLADPGSELEQLSIRANRFPCRHPAGSTRGSMDRLVKPGDGDGDGSTDRDSREPSSGIPVRGKGREQNDEGD